MNTPTASNFRNLPSRALNKPLLTGDMSARERLIVGIDYGTTFSGEDENLTKQIGRAHV